MTKMISALLLGTAMMVALPAQAQDKSGTNVQAGAPGEQGPVGQIALAYDLYDYGVGQSDALSVLAAARLLKAVDVKEEERTPKTEAREGGTAETGEGTDTPADVAMMFAKAKELAAGDDALLGMIADAETEGARGQIGGATSTLSRLPAGYYDIFEIPYYGGELAELAVAGDGDADLDLVVTDENGNVMCIDQSYSDQLYCSWTPIWDGYFYVRVDNMGSIRNSYYLMTN